MQTAVLLLVAFTVIITVTTVQRLASVIASRHSIARQLASGVTGTDNRGHKRLQYSDDVANKEQPHWADKGSIQQVQSSARATVMPGAIY